MKGDCYRSTIARTVDPLTGVEVERLSDDSGDTYHAYFTKPLLALDDSYIVLVSNRTGRPQLYTLRFADGWMVQITDEEELVPFSSVLDARRHAVYYFAGRTLYRVRLDNLETTELMAIPDGYQVNDLSIDDAGDYLVFAYMEKLNLCTSTGVLYSGMREAFYRRPLSVIIRYDIRQGQPLAVWGEHRVISHINLHPHDPDRILFCHEGPWELVHRLWTIDVPRNEVAPLLEQRVGMEKVGHEFFTASGRIGAQYSVRDRKGEPFYRHGELFVRIDGSDEQRYDYPYARPTHFQLSYDERLGVGDHAQIRANMDDARHYISLMRYADHRVHAGLLCRHGTSWKTQMSHPHPIFTRDDRYVIFSSDEGGQANVYRVRADWERTIKADR
ncbi:hypothetical protein IDH44_07390 [Paenibacillus sp. IB182496]|uniref:Oligogalacturonate lyase domain-containing protein n=1 Tax=Paenibacillus sabuli TaxID=2772509 RepID=A0A927GQX9_9BACL|nr:oligogalacturonate lyase family protein [Paenibacillus sabuli]MBD2845009.1 hypothetical protein [Paenibacillus sabuli]